MRIINGRKYDINSAKIIAQQPINGGESFLYEKENGELFIVTKRQDNVKFYTDNGKGTFERLEFHSALALLEIDSLSESSCEFHDIK